MYQNELYHHGIKGQRWGIQNGPPYPLNSPMSESKARKCAKKDAKRRYKDTNCGIVPFPIRSKEAPIK